MSCEIQVVARFIVTWVAPVVSPISVTRSGVSVSILETPFFIGEKGGKNRVKVRNIIDEFFFLMKIEYNAFLKNIFTYNSNILNMS